jgi:hypothetical protein
LFSKFRSHATPVEDAAAPFDAASQQQHVNNWEIQTPAESIDSLISVMGYAGFFN